MPRAFIGIGMSPPFRDLCVRCRHAVIAADRSWASEKWVAPENLHMTLRFLGIVPEPSLPHLVDTLSNELASYGPFRLEMGRPQAVPRARSASLIWVAPTEGGEAAAALAGAAARASAFLDFEPDGRDFRPHVTLARARHPRRLAPGAVDELERAFSHDGSRERSVSVRAVTLFGSTLTPRGPVYEELAIIPLGRD